jgi:membrane protein DedA with SNARE-associated domain
MLTLLSLVLGTFVSEDATCVAAGVLIATGGIDPVAGIIACVAGIVTGDAGLWLLGRTGMRVARLAPWVRRRLSSSTGAHSQVSASLQRHVGKAILASRFLPGTRLPLYLGAGAIGVPARTFVLFSLIAAAIWTPGLVLLAARLHGAGSFAPAGRLGGSVAGLGLAVLAIPIFVLVRMMVVRALRPVLRPAQDAPERNRSGLAVLRVRAAARLARWSRWEFWPSWVLYAPVSLWIGWLSIRYRGFATLTAANPAIPDGGSVGESKFDILAQLPSQWTIPSVRIEPDDVGRRLEDLRTHAEGAGWSLPLILKPDVGQRGIGVRMVRCWTDAERYLADVTRPVLAQPYHNGPFEAGVFYYRMPGRSGGRLLSVTNKVFPEIVGDGCSTLEALIWRHPRYRMQAETFLARHRESLARVLAAGERLRLAVAGNHAQGTMFCDGANLMTPALEARIDEIARQCPGFFIGRFDIRYRSVEAFTGGRDFAIVELNGVTAEPTSIYDPDASIWAAWRMMCQQWSLVFAIGAANRRGGARVSSLARLAGLARMHMTTRIAYQISD